MVLITPAMTWFIQAGYRSPVAVDRERRPQGVVPGQSDAGVWLLMGLGVAVFAGTMLLEAIRLRGGL